MLILLILSSVSCLSGAQQVQRFLRSPASVMVSPGAKVILPCKVENKGGECRWEKDGMPVGLFPDKYRMSREEGDCSLEVLDARLEWDDGWWQCQVSASSIVLSDSLMSPLARLTVTSPPASIIVREDRCEVPLASPPPTIQVLLGSTLVTVSQEDERLESGGWRSGVSLSHLMTAGNHGKTLTCRAQHLNSPVVETQLSLDIPFPPMILSVETDKEYYQPGDSALLTCSVKSNPPASISWRRGGETLETSGEETLVIVQVDSATSGLYQCVADSPLGQAISAQVSLTLAQPPVITNLDLPPNISLTSGQTLRVLCEVESLPTPEFRWLHRTNQGDINIVSDQALLLLESLDYHHAGAYLCEASNLLGEDLSQVISLDIKGRPTLSETASNHSIELGKSFQVEMEFCSNPAPDIISLSKDQELIISNLSGVSISESVSSKSSNCYLTILRFESVEKFHAGQYQVILSNSLGNDTFHLQLQVEGENIISGEYLIAIGCGVAFIITVFLTMAILCTLRQRCKARLVTPSSETDIEAAEKQSHNSCQELLGNNKNQSEAASSSSPPAYNQLQYPRSSNCGSMRRKKEEHYQDIINIYNSTIKHNLSSIYDPNSSSRDRHWYF